MRGARRRRRDEADDEGSRSEGERELAPRLVKAEQRPQDRGERSKEEAEQAARGTMFRGLAASGWHTAAMMMRLLVESELKPTGGVIGAGGEINWPQPVRPGDELHLESEVLEVRPSKSRPRQGLMKVRMTTLNQDGAAVQVLIANRVVPRRPAPAPRE